MSNPTSDSFVRHLVKEETVLSLIALLMAGISPNIFPAAQAGFAKMSFLATRLLIPSIVVLVAVLLVAVIRGHGRLVNRLLAGAGAGLVATVGLEIVRITSFRLGGYAGVDAGTPGSPSHGQIHGRALNAVQSNWLVLSFLERRLFWDDLCHRLWQPAGMVVSGLRHTHWHRFLAQSCS